MCNLNIGPLLLKLALCVYVQYVRTYVVNTNCFVLHSILHWNEVKWSRTAAHSVVICWCQHRGREVWPFCLACPVVVCDVMVLTYYGRWHMLCGDVRPIWSMMSFLMRASCFHTHSWVRWCEDRYIPLPWFWVVVSSVILKVCTH